MNRSELLKFIEIGILAPSADNLQPWKFKITNNQIDLFLDSERIKNFCDESLFAPYLSAGAVIENMRLAAGENGYLLSVSYFPDSNNPKLVASLWFTESELEKQSHFPAVRQRTTNRKFYSRKKIDIRIYSKFEHLIQTEKNFKLIWIQKNGSRYRDLCRILGEADQLRFENQRLHLEFMKTMRFTKHEREQTKDGLDFRTLESGPGSVFLFKLISSWNRLNFMNKFGMSKIFNFYTQLQLQTSQACGLIISEKHTPIDYVLGGEMMEKFWHEATLQNLSLQPMEALPIFLINLKETGCPEFDLSQKVKLRKLKDTFYSLFSVYESNGLIFLFRIGYADPPQARSLRRDVESFLVK